MSKDTLLQLTAQNALAGNVAPAFVPNSTTTVAGQAYVYDGLLYVAKEDGYQGPWDASKFTATSLAEMLQYPYLEYEDVKDLAVNGVCSFLYHGIFKRGLLNTDTGEIQEAFPFRIASETWFHFGIDLSVSIADGFQAGWIYESSGTYYFSGFKTSSMTIPGTRTFRVAIKRATEDQSEIADIKEFGSAVTFLTENEKSLNELKKTLYTKDVIRAGTESVQPCVKITKSIGSKLYVRAKVVLPDDFHNPPSTGFIDVLSVKGKTAATSKACRVRLYKRAPTTLTADPKIPCPEYRSGIYATLDGYSDTYSRIIPDGFNNIVGIGKDTMSIRFKGDPTVAANQDLMLKIDSSTISIYHASDNSAVASYTKSSYDSARAFYEAVLADTAPGEALEDYEVTWWNLDGYTLDDIIQCEVQLVAKYQTVKNGAYNTWRAFPFYFTTKDRNEHIVEVVFDKDATVKAQFILDGFGVEFPPLDDTVLNSIFNSDVEVMFGAQYADTGTVDFVDYSVSDEINFAFPLFRVYYAEQVKKGLDGSSYYLSEDKLTKLNKVLRQHNFGDLPMELVLDYLRGKILDNKRYFHFTHDDTAHNNTSFMDARVRETYMRSDITPSFGMLLNDTFSDEEKSVLKALRQCGWMYHIHNLVSSTPGEDNTSLGLFSYEKMVKLVNDTCAKFVEVFGEFPLVWDFHEVSEGYNQVRYLINRGFQLIFGDSGSGLLSPVNRYHCRRRPVSDLTDFNTAILPLLDNYVTRKRL
jgi:hypothetical protein